MKPLLALAILALLLNGCARFTTVQTEVRNETETTITTKAKATTFLSSKSSLANWTAKQAEGEQGASVGNLEQQSDGTVVTETLKEVKEIIIQLRP